MPAGTFNDVGDDNKTVPLEKGTIFGCIQASVVKRFALKFADGFAVLGTTGEHQGSVRSGVSSKHGEHLWLIFRAEVKEAVPRQDTVKTQAE